MANTEQLHMLLQQGMHGNYILSSHLVC